MENMHTDMRVKRFKTPDNVHFPREYFVNFCCQATALFEYVNRALLIHVVERRTAAR